MRVDDSDGVQFGPNSAFNVLCHQILVQHRRQKAVPHADRPAAVLHGPGLVLAGGRSVCPTIQADPMKLVDGYKLRLTMGHARHGVHSMYRDDTLMVSPAAR